MNEFQAKEIWIQKDVKPLNKKYLDELSVFCIKNREKIVAGIVENFNQACSVAIDEAQPFPIKYIIYTFLRTNIIEHNYGYQVMGYDEDWYFKKEPVKLWEYDATWAFDFFEALWVDLLKESKKYVGKINKADVENMMMRISDMYAEHVNILFQSCISECVNTKSFQNLKEKGDCDVCIGEYQGKLCLLMRLGK